MAITKKGIYYPDNYDKVADVPADLKKLAESVDTLIEENVLSIEKSNETRDGKISKNTEDIEVIQGSIKTATETINKKDNEQDGKITLNKESINEIQVENERLRNDIKSIALQGEASGENIHIEDSSNARCEIEIGGNHQQDTREGYNQLKNEGTTQTLNNVTITKKEDETLVVNGTATEDFTFSIKRNIELEDGEQYKLSGCPNGGDEKKYALTINQYYENQSHFGQDYGDGVNFKYNGSLPINNNIYIRLFKGITYNNLIFKPMIVKGTDTEPKPYEQYGASPSIDYPSPAKSVGDNVNLFPGWEMGTIDTATGNKITDPYYIRSVDFIPTLPNIDYTIYSIDSFGFNSLNTAIRLYDKDKKYLGSQYLGKILEKNLTFKITNLDARFMIPTSTNGQKNVIPGNAKVDIKLEKGIIATPYSSYNYGSAKVDIVNENIFNTENVKSTSEVSVVDNKNGVLELQGVNGFWKGITTTQKFETGKRVYIKCKVVEGTGSSGNIGIKDTNGDDILENYKVSNNLISCSFISKGITKIFFRCNGTSNNGNIKYSDIMFSYEDIDYIPHQGQSYLVDVQQPMFEGDTFVRQDGKWYEKHCWKKMLLNGTEKAGVSGASTNEILAIVYDINNAVDGFGYSNYFLYSSQVELKKMSVYNGGKSLRVNVSKMQFADSESFKAKLKELYEAGTPVIIYYKLAKPELIECTEAQSKVLDEIYNKIHTYKNITNISAESSEVNPIVSLKYLKDVEAEHNKLQAQIDEIKQLLSTTETSAMLLNNMQTDLESEV